MSETVEVMEDLGIIKITSLGKITENDLHNSRMLVREICRQRGLNKILVDATGQTNSLPTMAAFVHARILAEDDFFRKAKHAIIVSEQTNKDLHFLETAAYNRGGRVRLFSNREKALSWLIS
jgi:hypothetical protein